MFVEFKRPGGKLALKYLVATACAFAAWEAVSWPTFNDLAPASAAASTAEESRACAKYATPPSIESPISGSTTSTSITVNRINAAPRSSLLGLKDGSRI